MLGEVPGATEVQIQSPPGLPQLTIRLRKPDLELVYGIMWIWHRGSVTVAQRLTERLIPVSEFMSSIEARDIPRVPGTAVFLTRTVSDTPPVLVWHVKHNRALHDHLFVLRIVIESIPRIKESERLATIEMAPNFWRATARYGFMERPDIPALLPRSRRRHLLRRPRNDHSP